MKIGWLDPQVAEWVNRQNVRDLQRLTTGSIPLKWTGDFNQQLSLATLFVAMWSAPRADLPPPQKKRQLGPSLIGLRVRAPTQPLVGERR